MESLREFDAIYFGACGDPDVPSGILERGIILALRFGFDQAVNLRPAILLPGATSPLLDPGEVDFLVVREGTEGSYVGHGGNLRSDTKHEVATEVSVNTWYGVERTVRFAFAQAAKRRGALTYVHKHNVMVHAGHLWRRVVEHVQRDYPQIRVTYEHADAAAMYLVGNPSRYDVIVTDNLFGDILSDLAAAITGGIGLAASANINVSGTGPSLFEPIHGSAPDIAGQGIADPTAAVLSASLMADNLGLPQAAALIRQAVIEDMAARPTKKRRTTEIGDAITARIANA